MRVNSTTTRKQAIAKLALGGGVALLGLVILLFNVRWIRSAMHGPVPITLAELRQLKDPATLSNPWVSFTYDNAVDTLLGIATTKGGKTTSQTKFLLIQVQDRWLIAELPESHNSKEVVGYLDRWSVPLRRKSIDEITAKMPAYSNALLDYQLDAEYGYRSQCYAMLGVLGFFILAGLALGGWGLIALVRRPAGAGQLPKSQPGPGA